MEFQNNQVVLNKRGEYGVVASFNNQPCLLIFNSYTMQLSRFDDKGKCKNDSYSIVKVFQPSADNNITMKEVLHKGFNGEESLITIFESAE